jgi:hypothetical protein
MSCSGGSHLGFRIGIRNPNFLEDLQMIETTNMIKAKLDMNVHWMVFYNLKVFCSDMKFKMAATAELSLTLDPMGKMNLHVQFGFNHICSF